MRMTNVEGRYGDIKVKASYTGRCLISALTGTSDWRAVWV